ncbi:MAG: peptidoglycan recognition protein family protein [Oscillospiraceae bacterium]|nr:peptidoglycan recognition protein family protein [Oscillospiraceae bacterium]
MLDLSQSFITRNRTFSHPQTIRVRGLMIHSVGTSQPDASVFIRNWDRPEAVTSVHGVIEAGGRAFQLLPWTNRAWHAGGAANDTHIAVEMTEPRSIRYTGSGANFVDNDPVATRAFVLDTYGTAVTLFARLCGEFQLGPLSDGVIISHAEGHRRGVASNHADVEHLWSRHGLSMAQFRRDVAEAVGQAEPGEEIPATLLRVTTQTAPLNCRILPSATAPILGSFARGVLLTATRRAGDWFYVTDGTLVGWASGAFLTEAVPLAVDALVWAGIVNTPDHWLARYRDIPYLDRLLVNLAGLTYTGGAAMTDVEAAIGVLNRAGAIQSPDYWRERYHRVQFLDLLLMRAAGAI